MPEFTVTLREPHSFMKIWLVLAGVLAVCAVVLAVFVILRIIKEKKEMDGLTVKSMTAAEIRALRRKYLASCSQLEEELTHGIDHRIVFQRLSETARMFVYEATGLQVQNCTLSQIRRLKLQDLQRIIEKYYDPEFATVSKGDVGDALSMTKHLIASWTQFR